MVGRPVGRTGRPERMGSPGKPEARAAHADGTTGIANVAEGIATEVASVVDGRTSVAVVTLVLLEVPSSVPEGSAAESVADAIAELNATVADTRSESVATAVGAEESVTSIAVAAAVTDARREESMTDADKMKVLVYAETKDEAMTSVLLAAAAVMVSAASAESVPSDGGVRSAPLNVEGSVESLLSKLVNIIVQLTDREAYLRLCYRKRTNDDGGCQKHHKTRKQHD